MRQFAFTAGLIALAATAFGAVENNYRNCGTDTGFFYPSGEQYGDEVDITGVGTSRRLTGIHLGYYADLAVVQGDETATVRVYLNDGTAVPGEPGTLLFTSAPQPLRQGPGVINVEVPAVLVPDKFTVTVQFGGMTNIAGDQAGLAIYDPPTSGTSADGFWQFDSGPGTWGAYNFGGAPIANFSMSLSFGGCPLDPYDNSVNDLGFYFPDASTNENGDDVHLEGLHRIATTLTVGVGVDLTTPQGDETMNVRIRANDGLWVGGLNNPGTVLFDSGPIPLIAGANDYSMPLPDLDLPASFTVTIDVAGMAGVAGDRAGFLLFNPSVSGQSNNFFWRFDQPQHPGTWGAWWFGATGPQSNFKIRVESRSLAIWDINGELGVNVQGDPSNMRSSDNVYFSIQRGIIPFPAANPVQFRARTCVAGVPSTMDIEVESRCNSTGVEERVYIFNVSTGLYVLVGSNLLTTADTTRTYTVTGNLANFVDPVDGMVRVRIGAKNIGILSNAAFRVFYDKVHVNFTP